MSKKPDISIFIEVLRTLADQGAIDVEPTEREYDLTRIYNWLCLSELAERQSEAPYWLYLLNGDACDELADLLEWLSNTIRLEMSLEDSARLVNAVKEAFVAKKSDKISLTVGLVDTRKREEQ